MSFVAVVVVSGATCFGSFVSGEVLASLLAEAFSPGLGLGVATGGGRSDGEVSWFQ